LGESLPPLRDMSFILLFIGISTVIVLLFLLIPAVLTIFISTTNMDYSLKWQFIGLRNYQALLTDPLTIRFLTNTAIFTAGVLSFNVLVGLFLAILSTHVSELLGYTLRAVYLLPRVTPSVVLAFTMLWVFSPTESGVLNSLLRYIGTIKNPVAWTTDFPWQFLFLINGLVGCSLGMLIFTSAIKSIPPDYIVAARVDGASTLRIIAGIIVPMIRNHIGFVIAYQTLSLIASFEYILLTLDGGPGYYTTEVWALAAYHRAFSQYFIVADYGYAAAMVVILMLAAAILTITYWKIFRLGSGITEPKLEV